MGKDDKCGYQTKKEGKEYLLPSIRLLGRGLPLNMAAAHPKGGGLYIKKEEKPRNRGEERHCYSPPQGTVGYGK